MQWMPYLVRYLCVCKGFLVNTYFLLIFLRELVESVTGHLQDQESPVGIYLGLFNLA